MRRWSALFTTGFALVIANACGSEPVPDGAATTTGAEAGAPSAAPTNAPTDFTACDSSACAPPATSDASVPAVCGDGIIGEGEACDDRNTKDGDGCSANCTAVEPGYRCPTPGLACEAAKCGDGIVVGREECDFLEGSSHTGCSADCKIVAGYDCDPKTLICSPTLCGNSKVERGERCEDGNNLPFDGCFRCQTEPKCANGTCEAACGDGQRFASEECDDGNNRAGDGCSPDCKVERGYKCSDVVATPAETLDLPVLIRDFIGQGLEINDGVYHEDFNNHFGGGVLGVVEDTLGADGRSVYRCPNDDCDQNPGHLYLDGNDRPNFSTKANFNQWYRDTPGINISSPFVLTLHRENDAYVFDSANPAHNSGQPYFNPIPVGGWVAAGKEKRVCYNQNMSFTTETHFWFEYRGGERFDFSGDDDMWVFLNGKLAIDLGGLHPPLTGYFALDADNDGNGPDTADGTAETYNSIDQTAKTVDFGLKVGGIYEVVAFQAERQACGSNFKVTLRDFNRPKSSCVSTCGDGVVASDEVCDDGVNDGSYGGCMPGCKARGPFCGDGKIDPAHEDCDDGNQNSNDGCSNTCKSPVVK